MAKRKWAARPGSPITNEQAQIIGEVLDGLSRDGLHVTPERLVAWAKRHRGSPVADLFTFDADTALEKWLLHQARTFIGSVQVITVRAHAVKGFHSIQLSDGKKVSREYVRHDIVLDDENALSQVSEDLYSTIAGAVRKAADLGLTRRGAWRAIEATVNSNRP